MPDSVDMVFQELTMSADYIHSAEHGAPKKLWDKKQKQFSQRAYWKQVFKIFAQKHKKFVARLRQKNINRATFGSTVARKVDFITGNVLGNVMWKTRLVISKIFVREITSDMGL